MFSLFKRTWIPVSITNHYNNYFIIVRNVWIFLSLCFFCHEIKSSLVKLCYVNPHSDTFVVSVNGEVGIWVCNEVNKLIEDIDSKDRALVLNSLQICVDLTLNKLLDTMLLNDEYNIDIFKALDYFWTIKIAFKVGVNNLDRFKAMFSKPPQFVN